MSPKALILLADGFEDTEALCTADVLKRGGFVVDTASVRTEAQLKLGDQDLGGAGHVTSSAYANLKITPSFDVNKDATTIASADYSVIILPGGLPGATNLASSSAVIDVLKQQQSKQKWIAAICAAPVEVLKKKNLIGSAKVVCYPSMASQLGDNQAETGGKMTHVDEDHKFITSSGPATAMEFALTIVATLVDRPTADKVAHGLLYHHAF